MNYRVGDWVEVLGPEEILQTLDDTGALDAMPFMPEMLQFAGKRLRISASAHKACDTIDSYRNRGVEDSVHLGVRCDGSAHGGCQAGCLLYWKTTWLKPAAGPTPQNGPVTSRPSGVDTSVVDRATRAFGPDPSDREVRYSCQATRLVEASSPLRRTDVRQYWKDFASGNVSLWAMSRYLPLAVYNTLVSKLGHGRKIPSVKGLAGQITPSEVLDLQPGELVEVKSADEIMRTLNAKSGNRGLYFDEEMLPFCGKRYRVKQRVDRLIDERAGVMMTMKTPGIVLEDVVCMGCYHPARLFCPRGIYPYWREIWLKRVEEAGRPASNDSPN
ncbi:hypothetical protein [Rhodococcus tukisamuensis]|uniref:Uncharacterized protein n=1 Tax=Rhodococcus tukisamuensis TaxID=168276 RepID=A0A1G7AQ31_9NOCA|nr:hypothetical protein [Rhodococcus tukisamuensis]SDE15996.1 hypothetical protein SAMN05444580_11141 [Rhodococcus tukisamuensis]